MNPAAAPTRRFHGSVAAFLLPGTLAAGALAAALLALAALQRHVDGGLPWQAALAIAGLAWLSWSAIAVLFAAQRVSLHGDGCIEVRGAGTGFRRRRFHANEVQHAYLLRWRQTYKSPAGRLLLQLRPAPQRRWSLLAVIDSRPFDRGDGAVLQAVLDAVAAAQPGRALPRVERRRRPC